MTGPLERWYRRLLRTYPDPYRRDHGDELLTTLLDAARPGQRLPAPREAASLLAGGLRARALLAGPSNRRLWAGGLWLGAFLLVAENVASALSGQWLELSFAWSHGYRYLPSVLALLPILGLVAVLRGWRRTGAALVAATAVVAASPLSSNIGVYAMATRHPDLLARYLLPAAILIVLAWRSPAGKVRRSWLWLLLPVGLATVPALAHESHPSTAPLMDAIFSQLIAWWPVSGLLAVILPLAALALSPMDPRLPIAASVYLGPLVATALLFAGADGGIPIVAMIWGGLVALLLGAAVLGSRRLRRA
jgi:hypothetical protein